MIKFLLVITICMILSACDTTWKLAELAKIAGKRMEEQYNDYQKNKEKQNKQKELGS